jgi:hypothetical protein
MQYNANDKQHWHLLGLNVFEEGSAECAVEKDEVEKMKNQSSVSLLVAYCERRAHSLESRVGGVDGGSACSHQHNVAHHAARVRDVAY